MTSLSNTPPVNSPVDSKNPADEIFEIIKKSDYEAFQKFISQQSNASLLLNSQKDGRNGNFALLYASAGKSLEIFKSLLKLGCDINCRNDYGWTPVMICAHNNQIQYIKLLLQSQKINLDLQTEFGISALHCAIYQQNLPIIKLLLDAGCNIHQRSQVGMTCLMLACFIGRVPIVSLLLQKGAEINVQNPLNGWTAVLYALQSKRVSLTLIKLLLEYGADLELKTWAGFNAFGLSNVLPQEIKDFLGRFGKDDKEKFPKGNQQDDRHLIFDAITNDDSNEINRLLQIDPEIAKEQDPSDGLTPLILACMKGDLNIVQLLVFCGAPLQTKDHSGWTALMYAAYYNQKEIVKHLLEKGAYLVLPDSCFKNKEELYGEISNLTNQEEIIHMLKKAAVKESVELNMGVELEHSYATVQSRDDRSSISSKVSEDKSNWISKFLTAKHWRKKSQELPVFDYSKISKAAKPQISKKKTKTIEMGDLLPSPSDSDSFSLKKQKSKSKIGGLDEPLFPSSVPSPILKIDGDSKANLRALYSSQESTARATNSNLSSPNINDTWRSLGRSSNHFRQTSDEQKRHRRHSRQNSDHSAHSVKQMILQSDFSQLSIQTSQANKEPVDNDLYKQYPISRQNTPSIKENSPDLQRKNTIETIKGLEILKTGSIPGEKRTSAAKPSLSLMQTEESAPVDKYKLILMMKEKKKSKSQIEINQ